MTLVFDFDTWQGKIVAQEISNEIGKKILAQLDSEGECTATDLSEKLKLPLSTVLYHLTRLELANVVVHRRKLGKRLREVKCYRISYPRIVFKIRGENYE